MRSLFAWVSDQVREIPSLPRQFVVGDGFTVRVRIPEIVVTVEANR